VKIFAIDKFANVEIKDFFRSYYLIYFLTKTSAI
jgi:hypothetical protein